MKTLKYKDIILVCFCFSVFVLLYFSIFRFLDSSVSQFLGSSISAQTARPIELYFFYGQGCPHCAEAKPFLENLEKRYPQLKIKTFEVYRDEKNKELFSIFLKAYGRKPEGVPTIFLGEKVIVGYNESISFQIEQAIQDCLTLFCPSPIEKLKAFQAEELKNKKTEKQENKRIEEERSTQSLDYQQNFLSKIISTIVLFLLFFLILGLIIFSISRRRKFY